MDVLTAAYCVAGGLAALVVALIFCAFVLVVLWLVGKAFKGKAEAAGVNFADGIDPKEREILLGLLTSHRAAKVEQQVAVDIINAAQANLQKATLAGKP